MAVVDPRSEAIKAACVCLALVRAREAHFVSSHAAARQPRAASRRAFEAEKEAHAFCVLAE